MLQSNQGTAAPAGGAVSNRIFSLDVLRGIAITGVLLIMIRQLGGLSDMRQLWLQTTPMDGHIRSIL
ncbi:MAG: hypothetical protein IPP93_17365 [Chitinophagaceae bacterium]|nr:hypothetical protein [Chitinophagaceae bacterium]